MDNGYSTERVVTLRDPLVERKILAPEDLGVPDQRTLRLRQIKMKKVLCRDGSEEKQQFVAIVAKGGNVWRAKCRICFIKGYLLLGQLMINSLLLGTNNCKFPNDPICSAWVGQYTGADFSYHFGDGHHEGHWKSPLLRCASRIEKFPNMKSMFQHDHGMPSNEPKDLSMAKTSCPHRYSKTVTIQPNSPHNPTATTVPSRFPFRLVWLRFVAWKWRLQLDMWSWTICTSVILVLKVREANREGWGDKTRPRKGGPSRGLWNAYNIEMVLIHEDGLNNSIKKTSLIDWAHRSGFGAAHSLTEWSGKEFL